MEYVVEFKGNRRLVYACPEEIPVEIGKYVIVQAERGEDMGAIKRKALPADIQPGVEVMKVIRLAVDNDLERLKFNRQKEKESQQECTKFIEKHGLKMKLVDVEYQYDCNKITFYFTAEKRVDFRELVKDLAATFRTRIELRQIGVRDEAKRLGGYGICGKEQCCSSFLPEFKTISTQMARTQNLALNPQKISGNCGRLLCCLRYEQEYYEAVTPDYPPVGGQCLFQGINGYIEKCDIFNEKIAILLEGEGQKIIGLDEYKRAVKRGQFKLTERPKPARSPESDDQELGLISD
jgi:cell fate regulator YaaT (PSP1 superfamily)